MVQEVKQMTHLSLKEPPRQVEIQPGPHHVQLAAHTPPSAPAPQA